jgi:HlyD family secretion protein
MKIITFNSIVLLFILSACGDKNNPVDASGVFEATEIIVSSEATGKILSLNIREGQTLKKGELAGLVDSIQLHLSKLQLFANKKAILAGRPDVNTQIEAIEEEISKQEYEKKRIRSLLEGDVATQKQLDDINAHLTILKAKLKSQKSTLANSVNSIDAQSETIDVQVSKLEDQIEKCKITSPIDGTVLVKYAEEGEVTAMGKPLFKIADMDHMILRVYITADQLAKLTINQNVKVLAEFGETDTREYDGQVTWISDKSEFTPKTIQTQDERANLVYAAKVAVKNDDFLKIGMYGGIKFSEQ